MTSVQNFIIRCVSYSSIRLMLFKRNPLNSWLKSPMGSCSGVSTFQLRVLSWKTPRPIHSIRLLTGSESIIWRRKVLWARSSTPRILKWVVTFPRILISIESSILKRNFLSLHYQSLLRIVTRQVVWAIEIFDSKWQREIRRSSSSYTKMHLVLECCKSSIQEEFIRLSFNQKTNLRYYLRIMKHYKGSTSSSQLRWKCYLLDKY